ncbi:MAG TPA: glycosyltransferase [Kineosporiaceae bacterium]|nr:glycosyltransferase [Kineosporiaceae bacterium]
MTSRRLVIVVRADPVICGHSGEARNLAEAALSRGFDDVRLLTWPIPALQAAGLPLKPLDRLLPYSPGITVERPEPVGDYRVPDGRYVAGLVGRLVELLAEGVPTVVLSMYLAPHANVVVDAVNAARAAGLATDVRTVAKAVGSDVTNVIRSALREGRFGAAVATLATFLAHDRVVAVSQYTRDEIVAAAERVDAACGTRFADACRDRVTVSYPPVDTSAFLDLDPARVDAALARRGLARDGYVLFLSRVTQAKGIHDLVAAYARSRARERVQLVVAGAGPALPEIRVVAQDDDCVVVLDDVSDEEKPLLMRGCAAYVLPTKPEPDFVETFGIALVEKMLAGGGPVVTTITGGTGEAVGDTAVIVPAGDVQALADALDHVVLAMGDAERESLARRAQAYALQFDRVRVFDDLFPQGALPHAEVVLPSDPLGSPAG